MNKKDPSRISNRLTNVSSLTANVEVLEAESNIQKNKSVKLIERSKSSKKYNEDDLKEHTRIINELNSALSNSLANIKEFNDINENFLNKSVGLVIMFLSFIGICLAPILLKGNMIVYVFLTSLVIFLFSVAIKFYSFSSRKKRKEKILMEFKENKRKIKYLLNRKNQIKTYIALSHNSVYRRTFNANLFKLLKDEMEKSRHDDLKINYRVWEEFYKEIQRGYKQK